MYSALISVAIAILMSGLAFYKGRTAWHWFVLSLLAFATVWLVSAVSLYVANVRYSLAGADRWLSPFSGAVTCLVIVVLLVAVPPRPRRHAPPGGVTRRRSSS